MDLQKELFMSVRFLYHDKQLSVYHGNFFGGNELENIKVYIKSDDCIVQVTYLKFILMFFGRYYSQNKYH